MPRMPWYVPLSLLSCRSGAARAAAMVAAIEDEDAAEKSKPR